MLLYFGFVITEISALITVLPVTDAFFKRAFTDRVSQKYISRILAHKSQYLLKHEGIMYFQKKKKKMNSESKSERLS